MGVVIGLGGYGLRIHLVHSLISLTVYQYCMGVVIRLGGYGLSIHLAYALVSWILNRILYEWCCQIRPIPIKY